MGCGIAVAARDGEEGVTVAPVASDDEGCTMAELEESGSREYRSLTPGSSGGNK